MDTKQVYAGKIVAKCLLQKPHQKEKVENCTKFTMIHINGPDRLFFYNIFCIFCTLKMGYFVYKGPYALKLYIKNLIMKSYKTLISITFHQLRIF